jgi:tetratricopeptide (TPR) repeat protein
LHLRLPLAFALLLLALMAGSSVVSGRLSPPDPQETANEGYRKLWQGDADGAVSLFQAALRADPAFPYRWSDLGEALLAADHAAQAKYCFQRAVALAPHDPQIRLRAANFSFRMGDVHEALRLDSAVLRQAPDYDDAIFVSYVRMGGDLRGVLDEGIGTNARAAAAFFRFLMAQGGARREGSLDEVWGWMEVRGFADRPLARLRASELLRDSLPAEAADVWRKYVGEKSGPNQIENPGFENEGSGEGFDWHWEAAPGVLAAQDGEMAHTGHRSLRIRFDASDNLDFHQVYQLVWLTAGRYRFSGWMRTENFSTDQGIALRVVSTGVDAVTSALNGTNGWTELSGEFALARPQLVRLELVRRPSVKFDNRPKGVVWLDDVELRQLPGVARSRSMPQ